MLLQIKSLNWLAVACAATIALVTIVVVVVDCAPVDKASAMRDYQKVREGLKQSKRAMCSFLLYDLDKQIDEQLDLDKVTQLFEAALEHVAKTTSYITLMRPYVEREIVSKFDTNAGNYVLKLSDTRRQLIEDYEEAERRGESAEAKRAILESYFYKACDSKLSTIVTERSMYESALKAEKVMRVKLINDEAAERTSSS